MDKSSFKKSLITITGQCVPPFHLQTDHKRIELRGSPLPIHSPYIQYTLRGYYRSSHSFVVTTITTLVPYMSVTALRREIPSTFVVRFERNVRSGSPSIHPEWFSNMSQARHYLYFQQYHTLWKVHDTSDVWKIGRDRICTLYAKLQKDPVAYCFDRVFTQVVPLSKVEPFLTTPIITVHRQSIHYYERLLNDTIYHSEYKTSLPCTGIPDNVQKVLWARKLIVIQDNMVTATFVHDIVEAIKEYDVVLTNDMPTIVQNDTVVVDAASDFTVPDDATQIVVVNGSMLDSERYLPLLQHPASLTVVGDPRCLRASPPRWGMPPLPVPQHISRPYETIVSTGNLLNDLRTMYTSKNGQHTIYCIAEPSKMAQLNNMIKDVGGKQMFLTPTGQISPIRSVRDIPKGKKRGLQPPGGVMSVIPNQHVRRVVFTNKEEITIRHPTIRYAMATDQFFGDTVYCTLVILSPNITKRHLQTVRNRTSRTMFVLEPK